MKEVDTVSLTQEIKKVISKIIEADEERIDYNAHLIEDLGADSMMVLEIMAALDKKYNVNISESEIPKMTSLGSIVEIITRLLNA